MPSRRPTNEHDAALRLLRAGPLTLIELRRALRRLGYAGDHSMILPTLRKQGHVATAGRREVPGQRQPDYVLYAITAKGRGRVQHLDEECHRNHGGRAPIWHPSLGPM